MQKGTKKFRVEEDLCAAARNRTWDVPFPYHRQKERRGKKDLHPPMSGPPPPAASSSMSPSATRLPALYSASTLFQGNSSFGFQGVYPPYQPMTAQDNNTSANTPTTTKREHDLKKRRVSDSRRQRTPMSCDRCKIRKIKVRFPVMQ